MLYFAYGSNMAADQMRERCSHARFVSRGHMPGRAFIINSRGYANVVPDDGGAVHGVLWEIGVGDLCKLDVYEGTALGCYDRRTLPTLVGGGRRVQAEVYVSVDTSPGVPDRAYLATVLKGGRGHGLPLSYLRCIALTWTAQMNSATDRVR
jgi:gamma-glutamylcyclotransferase